MLNRSVGNSDSKGHDSYFTPNTAEVADQFQGMPKKRDKAMLLWEFKAQDEFIEGSDKKQVNVLIL